MVMSISAWRRGCGPIAAPTSARNSVLGDGDALQVPDEETGAPLAWTLPPDEAAVWLRTAL